MIRALTLVLTSSAPNWVTAVRPWLVVGCGITLVLARDPFPF